MRGVGASCAVHAGSLGGVPRCLPADTPATNPRPAGLCLARGQGSSACAQNQPPSGQPSRTAAQPLVD